MATLAEAFLCSRLTEAESAWLRSALDKIRATSVAANSLLPLWSAAGRRLGQVGIELSVAEAARLPFSPRGWSTDEYGRALLLTAAVEIEPLEHHVTVVGDLFRTGELREQRALLRALPYLPTPGRFSATAIEAVRSNATSVVEAIACDNPYPALHFRDEAFNQMVLKCLFNGLPLERVRGLGRRVTPELRRMVAAYASERRAAGRAVPKDAALVTEGNMDAPI
jgi:hypothetical protein